MIFKKLMAILLPLGFALPVFSQQKSAPPISQTTLLKGVVVDTGAHVKLKDAVVMLLYARDSIIYQFSRTLSDGSFSLTGVQSGDYLLHVCYPGYADYTERFAIDSVQGVKDFNVVGMILKNNLLKGVIIKGTASVIKIMGDTTEFNGRMYKLPPNAKVEDLLKRLPGIQVDKDGRISAQGGTISKVLVDGEEFFSDDPTLVTKNLRADMVDKVQLFDKRSDRATLTGIHDGKVDKTLNIKLKEDKKNGYFGKADVGIGTDRFYRGQLMFNSFKAKQRFSVYAIAGNDGKTSLDWQDNAKYASSNIDVSEPGMMIDLGGYDEMESHTGQFEGKGLPVARTGGLHYDNKWNKDLLSMNANYKMGALNVNGASQTQTQNNIPTGRLNSNTDQIFHNHVFRQKMDGVFQVKPDTLSIVNITLNGGIKHIGLIDHGFTTTSNEQGFLLNDHLLNSVTGSDQQSLNVGMLYMRKFKKPGRTISLKVIGSDNQMSTTGRFNSRINFYRKGLPDSVQSINQSNINFIANRAVNSVLNYSVPLTKPLFMIMSYGLAVGNSASDKRAYNQSASGSYDLLDSLYSSHFSVKQVTNQFGIHVDFMKNKTMLAMGGKVSQVHFREVDFYSSRFLDRNFILWNPQLNFQYHVTQQSSVRLNYEGNSVVPSVSQLQPVLINNDPLNITQGNPTLRPSFVNHLFAGYQAYNPLNGQLIGVFTACQLTAIPVVGSLRTDSTGRTINTFINLDNRNTVNLNLSVFFDRKIKPLDLNAGINLNVTGNTYYNRSNNELNRTDYTVYTLQTRFSKVKEQVYEFNASLGPTYTISASSLQRNINNNGKGFIGNGDVTLYLGGKFQFTTFATYQYNSKTETFNQDFSKLILNASLSKLFLKEQALKLSLSGNDLLNQNTGFNRNVAGNLITQNRYTTIRRYFMISVSYDFNKISTGKNNK